MRSEKVINPCLQNHLNSLKMQYGKLYGKTTPCQKLNLFVGSLDMEDF